MSILYIDDDLEDIEIFEEAIRTVDPSIQYNSITNGKDALDFLNACDILPDHLIVDINMPGMDGRSCLTAIRREKKFDPINVVIYSTCGFPGDIEQIESLGATFVQKATSFNDLCTMIRTLTGR